MTVQNFWKGLAMLLVTLALSAFGEVPVDWALLFVGGIAALVGYVGKNIVFIIDTTTGWAKVISGLLVVLGTGLSEAIGLIAVEGKIVWLVLFKVVGGVFLTYIIATFLTVPNAKSSKVSKLALFKK
ncbi:MAG: hypothetical protein JJE45_00040 [Prolixibacteraceae bacterium]|nr:hypothetical protein [Prolixibacteraceae bacterium]